MDLGCLSFFHWEYFLFRYCTIGKAVIVLPASEVPEQRSEVAVFLQRQHSQMEDLATYVDFLGALRISPIVWFASTLITKSQEQG